MTDSIFALSSGGLPSGVAIIRISGERAGNVLENIAGKVGTPRLASLRDFRKPGSGEIIDRGLAIWFPGPASFTGEDSCEFHLHGGPAVVAAMLEVLSAMEGLRFAEAGEFSRRAFLNGKHDLTEIEGLVDLIQAETEVQRLQAFRQLDGGLRNVAEKWREEIVKARAGIEAVLDFADEEDVPEELEPQWKTRLERIRDEIGRALESGRSAEVTRRGLRIVLMGKPNAGKSSLLNALARRDVAIVTEEAGTTRDVLEVRLDLGGYPVTIMDTAGIREAEGAVEREGVRRALERSREADLVVWLSPAEAQPEEIDPDIEDKVIRVRSKDDAGRFGAGGISVIREGGLESLEAKLRSMAAEMMHPSEDALVTRTRQRRELEACCDALNAALARNVEDLELIAEDLRSAGDAIGRLTGRIDVEELLDVIFGEFCIGK